ncbi:MAG: SDR family NAD(P)-dependent oxidoreductase [Byssovorax sp.]
MARLRAEALLGPLDLDDLVISRPTRYLLPMRIIITGANRGIGLELVRQCLARGDSVIATARNPQDARELQSLAESSRELAVLACYVGDDAGVRAFAAKVTGAVDALINNAGVMGAMTSLADLDTEDALKTYSINALGPLRVTGALLPQLRQGKVKKVLHVTSGMGSISDNTSGGAYGYRMSKAALNMGNRSMAADLKRDGIHCAVINPGWVKTDMGGTGALLPQLRRGKVKKVLHVTSGMGSIGDNTDGGAYGYRMSKAALNMGSRSMAVDLKPDGISVAVINPGWVKTDMGGGGAEIDVTTSAAGILAQLDGLSPQNSGEFLDHAGKRWPW